MMMVVFGKFNFNKMKKYYFVFILGLLTIGQVKSQELEITPFTGYTFDHRFPIFGGNARLGGGQSFGGMLGFQVNEFYEIEGLYSFQNGKSTARSTAIQNTVNTETNANYILLGANRLFSTSSQLTLFTGGKIGAGILAFPNADYNTISRFTVGFNGGVKYFLSENIGIRAQANLMVPISDVGANLWWSPGSGTSVGLSGWSSVIQFGFTGAVIFRISNKNNEPKSN